MWQVPVLYTLAEEIPFLDNGSLYLYAGKGFRFDVQMMDLLCQKCHRRAVLVVWFEGLHDQLGNISSIKKYNFSKTAFRIRIGLNTDQSAFN